MSRLTKIFVSVLGFAAVAAAAGHFYPPVRLLAIKAVGRSPVCPLENALKADENLRLQIKYKDEILAASKLVEKDPAGYHLWDTPKGRWWVPAGNDDGYVLPWNLAEQQRNLYGTGEQAVKPGDIVLDCGANVGVFTRKALDAGAKTVVSIEPAPENVEVLRRNFKNEIAAGRVILVPKGVWDKEDVLTLRRDPTNSAADSFVMLEGKQAGSVQVPLTTINKLMKELRLPRVDFIKMDIEGAEVNALGGGRETIADYHPRLSIAAEHNPDDGEKIPEAVRKAWPGYKMECGPCLETKDGRVRPDVLYFR